MWTELSQLASALTNDESLNAKVFFFPFSSGGNMPYLKFFSETTICNKKLRKYIINIVPFALPWCTSYQCYNHVFLLLATLSIFFSCVIFPLSAGIL